jgi:hypothetical protein
MKTHKMFFMTLLKSSMDLSYDVKVRFGSWIDALFIVVQRKVNGIAGLKN